MARIRAVQYVAFEVENINSYISPDDPKTEAFFNKMEELIIPQGTHNKNYVGLRSINVARVQKRTWVVSYVRYYPDTKVISNSKQLNRDVNPDNFPYLRALAVTVNEARLKKLLREDKNWLHVLFSGASEHIQQEIDVSWILRDIAQFRNISDHVVPINPTPDQEELITANQLKLQYPIKNHIDWMAVEEGIRQYVTSRMDQGKALISFCTLTPKNTKAQLYVVPLFPKERPVLLIDDKGSSKASRSPEANLEYCEETEDMAKQRLKKEKQLRYNTIKRVLLIMAVVVLNIIILSTLLLLRSEDDTPTSIPYTEIITLTRVNPSPTIILSYRDVLRDLDDAYELDVLIEIIDLQFPGTIQSINTTQYITIIAPNNAAFPDDFSNRVLSTRPLESVIHDYLALFYNPIYFVIDDYILPQTMDDINLQLLDGRELEVTKGPSDEIWLNQNSRVVEIVQADTWIVYIIDNLITFPKETGTPGSGLQQP